MDETSSIGIDESGLTKGRLRKLRALQGSVEVEIGERAFAAWLASQAGPAAKADGNAATIVDTLWPPRSAGRPDNPAGPWAARCAGQ